MSRLIQMSQHEKNVIANSIQDSINRDKGLGLNNNPNTGIVRRNRIYILRG